MSYLLPDGTQIGWSVLSGRRGAATGAEWDAAQWDIASWDGATSIDFKLLPEALIRSMVVKQGKDSFGRRFRAGSLTMVVDNSAGVFTLQNGGLQPGDYVWVRSSIRLPAGEPDELIPDGWQWQDVVGNTWTSHGSNIWSDDTPSGQVTWDQFYGRVDSAVDTVKNGNDVTKVVCYDVFAELAVSDKDAQVLQGAGESSGDRIQRIMTNASASVGPAASGGGINQTTMQATTLAQKALDQAHITTESEGGDMWASNGPSFQEGKGYVLFAGRDWLETEPRSIQVQWRLGADGLTITDANVSREAGILVNDATFANTGQNAFNSTDATSVQRYGLRTTRRLDLQSDQETQSQFLAQRMVGALKDVRPRIREVTVPVIDKGSTEFASQVQFGDLALTTVSSINGHAYTALGHVIGKRHEIFEQQWHMVIRLSDAFTENVDGAYNLEMFSNAFTLGETE